MTYTHVKTWREAMKRRLFEAFGSKCAICGLQDDPICYDFHHIDPKQKSYQLNAATCNWKNAKAEAPKCAMLCVICHRKLHAGQLSLPVSFQHFDETLITSLAPIQLYDDCRVCGARKKTTQQTCSIECSKIMRSRVDWQSLDLVELKRQHKSIAALGRVLGLSDTTIRKHMKRQNLL